VIEIHINPARIEKIVFIAGSEIEEDFDFAAWQAIRPLVNQIDERLRTIVAEVLGSTRGEQPT